MEQNILDALQKLENPHKIEKKQKYMKADKSQNSYAHGDIFVGISVPIQRDFIKHYRNKLNDQDIIELLTSPIHEYRHIALISLVEDFKKSKVQISKEKIFKIYLDHLQYINHWDLVDVSAPSIIGGFLYPNLPNIDLLVDLANHHSIWVKRMAMVATQFFIRKNEFNPTFTIANILWKQEHIMVQKALGWMLKEVSEKNLNEAMSFVENHLADISSLALGIAKEKYPLEIKNSLKAKKN